MEVNAVEAHTVATIESGDSVVTANDDDGHGTAASGALSSLVAIVGAGLGGVAALVGGIAIGSIFSGWLIEHVPTTSAHPVVTSLFCTGAITWLLARSVPWARLRRRVAPAFATDAEPSAGSSGSSRAWLAIQVIVAVAVTLVIHHQVLGSLASKTPGFIGDRDWYVFVSWKTAQLLKAGHSPFRMMSITKPYGYDVLLGDGFLPPLVGSPLYLFLPPYAAYNILLMLATISGFLSGSRLAGLFTKSKAAQLITAAAICTAPVIHFRYLGHLSMAFVFPVTLVIAEVVLLMRSGKLRPVRMTGLLLICFGCTAYYFLSAVAVVGLAVIILLIRRRVTLALLRSLAAVVVVLGLCLAPFLLARGRFLSQEVAAGSTFQSGLDIESSTFNSDVLSVVLPTFPAEVDLPGATKVAQHVIAYSGEGNYAFPGILLLVAGAAGLLLSRAAGARVAGLSVCALWVISLGPIADVYGINTSNSTKGTYAWLPYRFARTLPFLSGLRAPGRFSLVLPPLLGVGLALSLQAFVRASGKSQAGVRSRRVLFTVAAATLVFNVPLLPLAGMAVPSASGRQTLADFSKRPGRVGAVMTVPACAGAPGVEVVTQIWHGLDMVGCQGPFLGLPFASGMRAYRDSEDFIALSCLRASFVYGPLAPGMATAAISVDLHSLRETLDVRYLLIDSLQLKQCPEAAAELAKVEKRFSSTPVDERFYVVDLDQPR
jgi:hypothetical protein